MKNLNSRSEFFLKKKSVWLKSCDCFKTLVCNCSSLIFDKNAGNVYQKKSFRRSLKIHLHTNNKTFLLKKSQFYYVHVIVSKLQSAIAPVWYSLKMQVAGMLGLKTIKPFREALKLYLNDSTENLLWKCW